MSKFNVQKTTSKYRMSSPLKTRLALAPTLRTSRHRSAITALFALAEQFEGAYRAGMVQAKIRDLNNEE